MTLALGVGLFAACGEDERKEPAAGEGSISRSRPPVLTGVPSYLEVRRLVMRDAAYRRACVRFGNTTTPSPRSEIRSLLCISGIDGQEVPLLRYTIGGTEQGLQSALGAARQGSYPYFRNGAVVVQFAPGDLVRSLRVPPPENLAARLTRACRCGRVIPPGE
jgi:hypothetical protein